MVRRRVTTSEVVDDDRVVVNNQPVVVKDEVGKAAPYSALSQFIYLLFGIIESLLLIRFFFRLAGASTAAGFTRFIYAITNVLMAPFRLIFPTSVAEGAVFEWSILVAMAVYAMIAWIMLHLIDITYTADQSD